MNNDDIKNSVIEFLNSKRVEKGAYSTHTSLGKIKGRYNISSPADLNKFFTKYCNAVMRRVQVSVAEKPLKGGTTPLRGDVDLRFELERGTDRVYNKDHIITLVHLYQEIIRDIVPHTSLRDKMLYCVILEKQKPRVGDGVIKDGWHFHFPHFFGDTWLQDKYIRDRIIRSVKEMKLFDSMKLIEDVDKVIDPISGKTWLMYGSAKDEKSESYKATMFINHNLEEIKLEDVFGVELNGKKSKPIYYLPRLLSILDKEESPILDKVRLMKTASFKVNKRKKKNNRKVRDEAECLADLVMLEEGEIMDMLSIERADDYKKWLEVGYTLFNVGQSHIKALEMWIQFSKSSESFKEGECEKLWDTFPFSNRTVGSILWMAKNDSPDAYKAWSDMGLRNILNQALIGKVQHYPIAKVMIKMYKDKFICAQSKGDKWFHFKNHRWNPVDDSVAIKKLIPTHVADKFKEYREYLSQKSRESIEINIIKGYEEKIKHTGKIIEKLYDEGFMTKVVKVCKMFFLDDKFFKNMNENRNLFCFENGVYDLKLGLFRPGQPDDYITFSCGVNYVEYDWEDDDIRNVQKYLNQVFPNHNIRNYFLDVISSCLQGGNVNKLFNIMTGMGDNSKSIMVKIMEECFGDYIFKFPREMFVMGSYQKGSGPKPELTRVRGKRIAVTQEIAKTEKLNIGVLKELTGNDSFFARSHHEEGSDISPMFTLFLACNKPPKIPGNDEATWNRVRKIDFESTFAEDAPENEEEQIEEKTFPIDPDFADHIPDMAEPLMWMLIQRYKMYKETGLKVPSEVKSSTSDYQAENDIYIQFISERLEKVEDKTCTIGIREMYSNFKEWYFENHPSYASSKENRIGQGTMKMEICKRVGQPGAKNKWCGIRFKISEEEDDSFDFPQ